MSKYAKAHSRDNVAGIGTGKHFARVFADSLESHPERLDMWHPDLPEIVVQDRGPYHPRIIVHQSGDKWMGPVKYRALSPNDVGRRKPVFVALLLSLLLPLAAQAAEPCKVNVNNATPAQLALLVQTGPALAAKIEAARADGPLDAAKLDAVPGVGVKWIEYNTPYVTYSGETACESKLRKPAAPKPEAGKDGAQ